MGEMKRSSQVLAGLLGAAALAIAMMGLFGPVQQRWMDNMNLGTESYGEWWLLQIVPKMYSFDNQMWAQVISPEGEVLLEESYRVNHYAPSMVTFSQTAMQVVRENRRVEIAIRSRFRGECQFRVYRMRPEGEEESRAVLEEISLEESGFAKAELPHCE